MPTSKESKEKRQTAKQRVSSAFPLSELRYKPNGSGAPYRVVKNGFGHWSDAIIIGIGMTAGQAWANAATNLSSP